MRVLVSLAVLLLAGFAYYWLMVRDVSPKPPDHRVSQSTPLAAAPRPGRQPQFGDQSKLVEGVVHSEAGLAGGKARLEVDGKAQAFVEKLTQAVEVSLPATKAAHFVSGTQTIALNAEKIIDELRLSELKLDADLAPDTPITLVKQVLQIDLATPEKLIAESGGDLEREIRVLLDHKVHTLSVREALRRHSSAPHQPISVVKVIEYLEPTTLAELAADANRDGGTGWHDMIRIIKGPYRPEVMSVADLLAGIAGVEPDSVFYVHSVRPSDGQGVWGIIHHALIENFARGMAVRRGEALDTFRVEIPRDADERQTDNSSSFLGRLIDEKARGSAVYNFRAGRMSRNPHLIAPGNEIVIINFSPEELVGIYRYFLEQRTNAS